MDLLAFVAIGIALGLALGLFGGGGGILAVPFLVASDRAPVMAQTLSDEQVTVPVADPERDPPAVPMRALEAPEKGVYLGVSNFRLVERNGAVADWTAANGPHPRIVNWFQQWLTGERRFRPDWARRVARAGAVPMVTWEPSSAPAGWRILCHRGPSARSCGATQA